MPPTKTRAPKARLQNMTVGEISLVDRPANERPFLITKAAEPADPVQPPGDAPAPATEEVKADPMIAPDAKQAMLDELGACLEELAALAATIQDTPTQDGAPVPQQYTEMVRGSATKLMAVADQFAPTPPSETEAEPPVATETAAAAPSSQPAATGVALDAAAVEQALENVLQRYGVMKPTAKSADAPAEPTTKSLSDQVAHLTHLTQGLLARQVAGSLAKGATASNAAAIEKTDTKVLDLPTKPVVWGQDFSATVLAEQAQKLSAG